jgi:hypothetical protein
MEKTVTVILKTTLSIFLLSLAFSVGWFLNQVMKNIIT